MTAAAGRFLVPLPSKLQLKAGSEHLSCFSKEITADYSNPLANERLLWQSDANKKAPRKHRGA